MRLKNRLALVVALFMSAFVLSYSFLLLIEVPERADAETAGTLPWVLSLLPARVDAETRENGAWLEKLRQLVGGLDKIRHVKVALFLPDGTLVASTPSRPREVPGWLSARLSKPQAATRKNVLDQGRLIAYFEVTPAVNDELAELWEDFLRSSVLVVGLALAALTLIIWSTFRALAPLDRIRDALRAIGTTRQGAPRLPAFNDPEMDNIATSFNRMADALAASDVERQSLLRKLVDSDESTRRSVAHDLHDELSPYLVALQPLVRTLQLQCAKRPDFADLAATVETMTHHQSHILTRLRSILMGLHPPELETWGLRGAIEQMAVQPMRNARGEPLEVIFRAGGSWTNFGPTLDVSVYRLMQECLTNVQRHGTGDCVDIVVNAGRSANGHDAHAVLDIEISNGCEAIRSTASTAGFAGLGMLGMRDRCIALGGSFESGPGDDMIWRTHIRLPLDADEFEESLP